MDFVLEFLPAVLNFVLNTWPGAAPWILGAGVLCLVLSVIASAVNLVIAHLADAGAALPGWALKVAAVANLLAGNLDKAGRFLRGYRGAALPARTKASK